MKFRPCISCILLVLLIMPAAVRVGAEQFNGGNSMQYATSAFTISPGEWNTVLHTRGSIISSPTVNYYNASGALSFNYGLYKHLEAEVTSIFYQDINITVESHEIATANTPDDFYFRFKAGDFALPLLSEPLFFGAQFSSRISGNAYNNVYLEPYTPDANTLGLNLLFSYYPTALSTGSPRQVHLNFGYINYNDVAGLWSSTQALRFFGGYVMPFRQNIAFLFELNATMFMNYTPRYRELFSMEHFAYATPSIRYQLYYNIYLACGIDLLVYSDKNWTNPAIQPEGYPDYPWWRITSKLVLTSEQKSESRVEKVWKRKTALMDAAVKSFAGYVAPDFFEWGGKPSQPLDWAVGDLEIPDDQQSLNQRNVERTDIMFAEKELAGMKSDYQRDILLKTGDLKDPRALAIKLKKGEDLLSRYIYENISVNTRRLLKDYRGENQPGYSLVKALAEEISRVILDENLYNRARFAHVELSPRTRKMIEESPFEQDFSELNMHLIEDAFPHDIEPSVDYKYKKLHVDQVKNPIGFTTKIRNRSTALAAHIRDRLPEDVSRQLQEHDSGTHPPRKLLEDIVHAINGIIKGESLYREEWFQMVTLSRRTLDLLFEAQEGRDYTRINKMLIEDAYPDEIHRRLTVTTGEQTGREEVDESEIRRKILESGNRGKVEVETDENSGGEQGEGGQEQQEGE